MNSTKIVTIFDDKDNYNATHPLTNEWVLWYDCPNKKITNHNWIENIKQIYKFNSLENFWSMYNIILKSSSLSYGSNYYLFKNGIKPMWEDPTNENGGKWCIQLKKNLGVDSIWLYTVLNCIGENFYDELNDKDYNTEITGVIVNIRKYQDKVNVWLKDKNNQKAIDYVGNKIQNIMNELCIDNNNGEIIVTYQEHS